MVTEGLDIKEVREEIAVIQKERDFLEKELLSLNEDSFNGNDISNLVTMIESLIFDFERIFKDSPVHIQKKLIRLFVEKIEVDPEENTINYFVRNVPWIDERLSTKFDFGNVQHEADLYPIIKADRRNAHVASTN